MQMNQENIMTSSQDAKKKLRFVASIIGIGLLFYNLVAVLTSELLQLSFTMFVSTWGSLYPSLIQSFVQFINAQSGQWMLELLVGAISGVATIFLLRALLGIRIKSFFGRPHDGFTYTLEGTCWFLSANYILSFITSFVILFFTMLMGHQPYAPDFAVSTTNSWAMIFNFSYAVIVAPIVEEILFRGFILRSLQRFGNVFAIMISSILFGLWHGNLEQALPIIFASMIFGYVAIGSNSIIPTIIAHMVNNLFAFVMSLLEQQMSETMFSATYTAIILVIIVLSVALLYIRKVENVKIQDHNMSGLRASTRTATFLSSPVMILVIIYIAFTLISGIWFG